MLGEVPVAKVVTAQEASYPGLGGMPWEPLSLQREVGTRAEALEVLIDIARHARYLQCRETKSEAPEEAPLDTIALMRPEMQVPQNETEEDGSTGEEAAAGQQSTRKLFECPRPTLPKSKAVIAWHSVWLLPSHFR